MPHNTSWWLPSKGEEAKITSCPAVNTTSSNSSEARCKKYIRCGRIFRTQSDIRCVFPLWKACAEAERVSTIKLRSVYMYMQTFYGRDKYCLRQQPKQGSLPCLACGGQEEWPLFPSSSFSSSSSVEGRRSHLSSQMSCIYDHNNGNTFPVQGIGV